MEIQKIFSDIYDEERIYSVLMTEDELRMFTGSVKRANKALKKAWFLKGGVDPEMMSSTVKNPLRYSRHVNAVANNRVVNQSGHRLNLNETINYKATANPLGPNNEASAKSLMEGSHISKKLNGKPDLNDRFVYYRPFEQEEIKSLMKLRKR